MKSQRHGETVSINDQINSHQDSQW